MLHRPRKGRHYSRYAMGFVFLACGALLTTVNLMAGAAFLLFAAIVFYYAPRWNLRIELTGDAIRFSENVVETYALELRLADLLEVRRVEEKEERKGFLSTYPEYYPFVEFETREGKTYRMHDIFGEAFDDELVLLAAAAGVRVSAFPRTDGIEDAGQEKAEPV
jgi:hypothetical protein